jgi:hypothetical protein
VYEKTLRDALGIAIVVSHILIALVAFFVYLGDGLLFEEMTNILSIVVPTFSAYTTAVVTYFINNPHGRKKGKKVVGPLVTISLLFPAVYLIAILALIILKGFTRVLSFDQVTMLLAVAETLFAAYAGKVITWLFGEAGKTSG